MSSLRMVSSWVVCDLETKAGRATALAAVKHVKSSNQMRVAFIHNTENPG